jgi:ligand-binding sensor domain-containing protein/signal transduction histidine kinase
MPRWFATILFWGGFVAGTYAASTNHFLEVLRGDSPDFTIKTLRMSDGLPSDRVRAVLQTRDGYIWIATFNGLARFDGIRFQTFRDRDTPALRNSLINSLFEDSRDRLWIGNDTGEITWRDTSGFRVVEITNNWPAGPVDAFVESPRGVILALNREGIICVISNGVVQKTIGSLTGLRYSELVTDRGGQIWAVRRGGRVVGIHAGQEVADAQTPPPGGGFRNIAPARRGGLWIRTGHQLKRWHNGAFVEDRGPQPWQTTRAVTMFETVAGDLVVGTFNEGIFIIRETGPTIHLNRENGLPHNWVASLHEDREHNLWLGTGAGLTQLRRPILKMLNPEDRWQQRAVESVWPDPSGGLWIGTLGAGIYHYQENLFRRYWNTVGGPSQDIRAVLMDRTAQLWIGTQSGLHSFQTNQFSPAETTVRIPALVYALHEARDGTLWVGTQSGVARRHPDGRWSRAATELYRADVRSIVESPNGDIWLGMRGGGVARYAAGEFQQYRTPEGLPYDYVWSLLADADGDLWICTSGGGLARWRQGTFVNFTTANGFPSDFICAVQDDEQGHLWIASYGGIFRVAKAELDRCARGEIKSVNAFVLGASDGLASLEMSGGNHPASCRLPDGRIAFPTSDGLAVVNPRAIRVSYLPPPVRIEAALVDREPAPITMKGHVTGVVSAPEAHLVVPPGKTQIQFQYTALSFAAPERLRFKIRLLNVDRDWVDVGERRTAHYSHVPPGEYLFQVIAANNHGVWNEDGATLRLIIQPFFWQTWWFAPMCWLGFATLIGAGVVTILRRRHYRRVEALERARLVERERRRIAQDLHDDLGAGLTEIDSTSVLAHETATSSEEARDYFREISTRSRELITSMDEIVWAVNPRNDNLASVTTYFCHYAEQFLRTTSLSCRFEIPENLPLLPLNAEQRHSLFLAFKEALTNAVRHSGGTAVTTTFALNNAHLCIAVTDDGCGWTTIPTHAGSDGLQNLTSRLEQLGGRCEIISHPGKGTTVTFHLPIAHTN